MSKSTVKNQRPAVPVKHEIQQEVRRNMRAWTGLYGALRGKTKDPIKWQQKIRREWERKLP